MDLKTLSTSPAFYMGCKHIDEAETERGKKSRTKTLCAQLSTEFGLAIDLDVFRAALAVQPTYHETVTGAESGYYELTRDIPNPMLDRRSNESYMEGTPVFKAGTRFTVKSFSHRGEFRTPSVQLWLEKVRFGRVHEPDLLYLVLAHAKAIDPSNLREAMRTDGLEDHHMRDVVMQLIDDGTLTLEKVRKLAGHTDRLYKEAYDKAGEDKDAGNKAGDAALEAFNKKHGWGAS